MTQLWLMGTRMDSIPLLRLYVNEKENAVRPALCMELMQKYQSGILAGWLRRQSELRPLSSLAQKLNPDQNEAQLCRLLDEPPLPLKQAIPLLALLCQTETAPFETALEEMTVRTSSKPSEKQRLIEQQRWYQESIQMQELFENINWERVVYDTDSLTQTLHQLYQEERAGGQQTLYLCNTGSTFTIRNPEKCFDLRMVGCGAPLVRFSSQNRGRTLDLEAQNLLYEDLCLLLQGMKLLHAETRLIHVEVE